MVPRILMASAVMPTGDAIEVLRPRHGDLLLRRFFSAHLPLSRRFERYPLDSRGSRIWCLIDNQRRVRDVVAEYQRFYPDDRHQVADRVRRYLKTLADHGFIEIVAD